MLEQINCSKDLKELKYKDLEVLSGDIRREITDVISKNGGHLASNLGIVETTIALHRVFDLPDDKIIFDVGHQCYAHKLLTGRKDRFYTIRKKDGISGFTNRFESEYDTFTAGHSGTSISAGLGLAKANKLCGRENYVVSVVGDGSFTNGMIYEAINNCCDKNLKFIIVLNDNEMSISSNVGNLSRYFSRLRSSRSYFRFKHKLKRTLSKVPKIGNALINFSSGVKRFFKRIVLSDAGFFSAMGIRSLGPVDGHDIKKLEDVFNEAKSFNECSIILIRTKKGKGYDKAQEHPEDYHSVSSFNPDDGVCKKSGTNFSEQFGQYMVEKAKEDKKLVALTAAMCEGTGLLDFSKAYPDRFFDVGIAEEHEVTFAAGLSAGGLRPVCAVYSTFAQRVYDQVVHDLSVQNIPCVLALDRAGFVPDDGITHQGVYDVSLFSSVPRCDIYSPETYEELRACMDTALSSDKISVVRYPKGSECCYERDGFEYLPDMSASVFGEKDADVVIITYGRICKSAFDAASYLKGKYSVKIVKLVKAYPFDEEFIKSSVAGAKLCYILEEGIKSGGVGEKLSCCIGSCFKGRVIIKAIDNVHAFHATTNELIEHFGMSGSQISKEITDILA